MIIPASIPIKNEILIPLIERIFKDAGYLLQDYQRDVILCNAMRVIILKARGIGITVAMALKILLLAMTIKGEYIVISHDKDSAMHVLTSIQDFYNVLIKYPFDWNCKMSGNREGSKDEKHFSNGSVIKSVSSTPKAIRGYHGFVFWDEAAFHTADKELRKAIRGCLMPAFPFYIASTPNEMVGEFYKIWEEGKKKVWKKFLLNYEKCQVPGYQQTVLQEKEDALSMGLLDDWAQEYNCKFIDGSTRLFNWPFISEHVEKEIARDVSLDFAGIDFGKKADHSELVSVGKDKNGIVRVPRLIEYQLKQDYTIQVANMAEWIKNTKSLKAVFPDLTGVGNSVVEPLQQEFGYLIKPISFTNQIKEKMIMYLYTLMHSGGILLPDDKKLKEQLHSLRRETTDTGLTRYKHEEGKHDDRVWALALALQGYAGQALEFNDAKIETSGKNKYATNGIGKISRMREMMRRLNAN
jgi:phage FluMu gp28-like protein